MCFVYGGQMILESYVRRALAGADKKEWADWERLQSCLWVTYTSSLVTSNPRYTNWEKI